MSHVTHEWGISLVNEACHIWMRHVTCECMWQLRHIASRRIWMRHVKYRWVRSHVNEVCHIWMCCVTYEWVVSHMNESSYTDHEWKLCLQVLHMNISCHIWMSHVTQIMNGNYVYKLLPPLPSSGVHTYIRIRIHTCK